MHTENRITIDAPGDLIYELAQNVIRWPDLLTHYRYVRVLREDDPGLWRLVHMGARRGRIPVRWTAEQALDPAALTISYRHVAGVTRGMEVMWRIVPAHLGCAVSIVHDLPRPCGLLRLPFAPWIAGNVFVEEIAARTLEGIKRHAEVQAVGATE